MTGFLGTHDLAALTKRTKYTAQRRVLDKLGIRYTMHPDGIPIVMWDDVNNPATPTKVEHQPEPNFEALLKRGPQTNYTQRAAAPPAPKGRKVLARRKDRSQVDGPRA